MNSNRPFAAVILILTSTAVCPGAEPGQVQPHGPFGFVRVVNAVSAGTGELEFRIDGRPARGKGYQPGDVTGGIALQPESHKITFLRDGVRRGTSRVTVKAGETTILIPFAEWVPALDDEPAHWRIRVLRLKQHDAENQRIATFVSVSREPERTVEIRQSDGKWEPVIVKRLGFARAEINQSRGYLPVRCGILALSAISVGAAGNHVSVLYEDENGVLRSKTFRDYKYAGTD